jgi:hypothetical protein
MLDDSKSKAFLPKIQQEQKKIKKDSLFLVFLFNKIPNL